MPEFRIISENFKNLSELEKILQLVSHNRNNEIKRFENEGETNFDIINPKTRNVISFSVYDKEEFLDSLKLYDNKYGGIFQINWSSKMSIEEIDNLWFLFIKELGDYLPNILIEQGGEDYFNIEEFIKMNKK